MLQGLLRTLRAHRPIVYYEFEGRFYPASFEATKLLKALDYACEPDGRWGAHGAPCAAISCDILCWPKEDNEKVQVWREARAARAVQQRFFATASGG